MNHSPFNLPRAPHSLSAEEIFGQLHTDAKGLSSEEAAKRLKLFGENRLKEEKTHLITIFFRQFKNVLIYVLIAASIISILLGELVDFFVIIGVITLNSLLGFWQETKAERSIQALKKLTESMIRVNRDGQIQLLPSSKIVPGDMVFLKEGEIVTADLRLTEDTSLLIDESSLTGESTPIGKNSTKTFPEEAPIYDCVNMALAGTTVVRGEGKGVVTHTGTKTYFGKIAEKTKESPPKTPLTKAMRHFAKWLVIGLCILFFFLFLIGFAQERASGELAYILVACLVSAVPEGLPIVITLVVVIGAIILSRQKAYVRVLPSVETLGSATVIASDKTGTITEGKLIVQEWTTQDLRRLQLIGALCNDVHQEMGDPLDLALWKWIENAEELKAKFPRKWSYPFDARAMLMAVVHEIENQEVLLVKGAYESLKKISDSDQAMDKAYEKLLEKGYRVLAFGMGNWQGGEDPDSWKIQIIGFVGFLDPPKAGVKEAVAKAKEAHIKVLMITGDHLMTARMVAKEVGIWHEGDQMITGPEMEKMNDEQLIQALKKSTVLARILPEHKYRVVKLLQAHGEVVSVTGDGVNDVPALKTADLGIAMGSGTEAAKSVSEMIITDSNFKVIVEAIKRGRVITDNIRKVLYYLLSTSLQEICLISLSIFTFLPLPLTAVQILWINLVTDGVQVQFFAFIKEEGDVMKHKPKKPAKKFIDKIQIVRVALFGIGIGVFIFCLYFVLRSEYPLGLTSSIIFTSTVMAQWANGIQAQKENEPFFKNIRKSLSINPLIFVGISAGVALQLAVIYVFPNLFKVTPLSLFHWSFPIGTFFIAFAFVEVRKWVEHHWQKRNL